MRWRTLRDVLILLLLLALGLVGVTAVRISAYQVVVPRGETLREHLAVMPEPVEYRLVGAGEHLAVIGPMPSSWAFASGPPIYIFERSGVLIDAAHDSGDSDLHSRWPGIYDGKRLTRAEAEAWVAPMP